MNDGVTNLLKYAFGLDVMTNAADKTPVAHAEIFDDSPALAMNFPFNPNRNDIDLTVEVCDALGNWTPVATSIKGAPFTGRGLVSQTPGGGSTITVKVRDPLPESNGPRRFMRLNVTK